MESLRTILLGPFKYLLKSKTIPILSAKQEEEFWPESMPLIILVLESESMAI